MPRIGPNHHQTFSEVSAMTEKQITTTEEIFKPIPDFPGYEASTHGRIRSYWKRNGGKKNPGKVIIANIPQRFLKPVFFKGNGYFFVTLQKGGKGHIRSVHSLILITFVGPPPPGHECCHGDGIRSNCTLINLRWGTRSENMLEKYRHGYSNHKANSGGKKLTENEVLKIRLLCAQGHLQKDIAKNYNVHCATIGRIARRQTWTHLP